MVTYEYLKRYGKEHSRLSEYLMFGRIGNNEFAKERDKIENNLIGDIKDDNADNLIEIMNKFEKEFPVGDRFVVGTICRTLINTYLEKKQPIPVEKMSEDVLNIFARIVRNHKQSDALTKIKEQISQAKESRSVSGEYGSQAE